MLDSSLDISSLSSICALDLSSWLSGELGLLALGMWSKLASSSLAENLCLQKSSSFLEFLTCIFLPLETDSSLGCFLRRFIIRPLMSGDLARRLCSLTRLVGKLVDEPRTCRSRLHLVLVSVSKNTSGPTDRSSSWTICRSRNDGPKYVSNYSSIHLKHFPTRQQQFLPLEAMHFWPAGRHVSSLLTQFFVTPDGCEFPETLGKTITGES